MDGVRLGDLLEPGDGDVHVARRDLQKPCLASGPLRCDQGRATAAEQVEHDGATAGYILDRVGNQGDWLDGGGRFELLLAAGLEAVDTRIVPDIRAVAAKPAELDIVDVFAVTDLEEADQLVL